MLLFEMHLQPASMLNILKQEYSYGYYSFCHIQHAGNL